MEYSVVKILELSNSIGEIAPQLQGWKNFFKFKEKRQLKNDIKQLHKDIDNLMNDEWYSFYVEKLQSALFQWKSVLEDLYKKNGIHISDTVIEKMNMYNTMYFQDNDFQIMIDIIGNNLKYTVFNLNSGKTYTTLSVNTKSKSQESLDAICKKKIIAVLHEYLDQKSLKKSS